MDDFLGRLVISVAGRDKGLVLCAVKADKDYVYLADGKLRKLESPKKKKYKHVRLVVDAADEFLEPVDISKLTNRMIKARIHGYLLSCDALNTVAD